jgi:catechol 2,3-dioxygenase-like lactoylglutathione lyase family enzyme
VTEIDLDHIVVAFSDWERSKRFYVDALGAEPLVFASGRRALRVGSVQLDVHLPDDLPDEGEPADKRPFGVRAKAELRPHSRAVVQGEAA